MDKPQPHPRHSHRTRLESDIILVSRDGEEKFYYSIRPKPPERRLHVSLPGVARPALPGAGALNPTQNPANDHEAADACIQGPGPPKVATEVATPDDKNHGLTTNTAISDPQDEANKGLEEIFPDAVECVHEHCDGYHVVA